MELNPNIKEGPLVSVIIPVYNDFDYLKEAIDSIINQTYTNWELIIVDDGSEKSLPDWVMQNLTENKYTNKISFKALPMNVGLHAARNEGIKIAKGKYIAILDADDAAVPERLQNSVTVLEQLGADLVYGAWLPMDPKGQQLGNLQMPLKFEDNIEKMNPICHGTVTMRKTALGDDMYPTYHKYAMDYALWYKLWKEGKKIVSLPVMMTRYRVHPDSITQSKKQEQEEGKNAVINCWKDKDRRKAREMVSVIMPTFSEERQKDIFRAVASIWKQDYNNWELIIVNDGGLKPDWGTINDSRINYIEIEHKGLSGALNAGLKAVKGNYVAFLDDDDLWAPDHLSILMKRHDGSSKVVYAQTQAITPDNDIIRNYNVMIFSRQQQRQMNLFTICSTLTTKECFNVCGKFDESLKTHMDWEQWLKIGKYFDIIPIDIVTSYYVQHPKQISKDPQHLKDRDTVRARWN